MTGVLSGEPGLLTLALRDLRRSAEPAVVLSSLARLSVPCFSDGCELELSEGLDPVFEVSFPLPGEEPVQRSRSSRCNEPPAGAAVITAFDMPSDHGRPSFSGTSFTVGRYASRQQRTLSSRGCWSIMHWK